MDQIWGRVSDVDALEAAVKATWNTIPEERFEGLIRSMLACLQVLTDADGHATLY